MTAVDTLLDLARNLCPPNLVQVILDFKVQIFQEPFYLVDSFTATPVSKSYISLLFYTDLYRQQFNSIEPY